MTDNQYPADSSASLYQGDAAPFIGFIVILYANAIIPVPPDGRF